MTEASIIHPATQRWLEANGYEFQHEVAMPQHGRADFVARRGDETLVIECKKSANHHAVRQVLDYAQQTGYIPAVAAPAATFDSATRGMCLARGVRVIELPLDRSDADENKMGSLEYVAQVTGIFLHMVNMALAECRDVSYDPSPEELVAYVAVENTEPRHFNRLPDWALPLHLSHSNKLLEASYKHYRGDEWAKARLRVVVAGMLLVAKFASDGQPAVAAKVALNLPILKALGRDDVPEDCDCEALAHHLDAFSTKDLSLIADCYEMATGASSESAHGNEHIH